MRGIVSRLQRAPLVLEATAELPAEIAGARLGVVAQTTQNREAFAAVVARLRAVADDIRVANTICQETRKRQEAVRQLACSAAVMIIIGGKNSANTARLAALCRDSGCETHYVETAAELRPELVRGCRHIGIAAGASTPRWLIDEVRQRIAAMIDGQPA